MGRLATVGDVVDLDGWTLTVTRMDGRRIDQVLARPSRLLLDGVPAGTGESR